MLLLEWQAREDRQEMIGKVFILGIKKATCGRPFCFGLSQSAP